MADRSSTNEPPVYSNGYDPDSEYQSLEGNHYTSPHGYLESSPEFYATGPPPNLLDIKFHQSSPYKSQYKNYARTGKHHLIQYGLIVTGHLIQYGLIVTGFIRSHGNSHGKLVEFH